VGRKQIRDLVRQFSTAYNVPYDLALAILEVESNYQVDAVSPKGAKGLMQLMPVITEAYGVQDPFDPVENIRGGIQFFGHLLEKYGDPQIATAAYHAGETHVDNAGGRIPNRKDFPDTLAYVEKVRRKAGMPRGPQTPAVMQGKALQTEKIRRWIYPTDQKFNEAMALPRQLTAEMAKLDPNSERAKELAAERKRLVNSLKHQESFGGILVEIAWPIGMEKPGQLLTRQQQDEIFSQVDPEGILTVRDIPQVGGMTGALFAVAKRNPIAMGAVAVGTAGGEAFRQMAVAREFDVGNVDVELISMPMKQPISGVVFEGVPDTAGEHMYTLFSQVWPEVAAEYVGNTAARAAIGGVRKAGGWIFDRAWTKADIDRAARQQNVPREQIQAGLREGIGAVPGEGGPRFYPGSQHSADRVWGRPGGERGGLIREAQAVKEGIIDQAQRQGQQIPHPKRLDLGGTGEWIPPTGVAPGGPFALDTPFNIPRSTATLADTPVREITDAVKAGIDPRGKEIAQAELPIGREGVGPWIKDFVNIWDTKAAPDPIMRNRAKVDLEFGDIPGGINSISPNLRQAALEGRPVQVGTQATPTMSIRELEDARDATARIASGTFGEGAEAKAKQDMSRNVSNILAGAIDRAVGGVDQGLQRSLRSQRSQQPLLHAIGDVVGKAAGRPTLGAVSPQHGASAFGRALTGTLTPAQVAAESAASAGLVPQVQARVGGAGLDFAKWLDNPYLHRSLRPKAAEPITPNLLAALKPGPSQIFRGINVATPTESPTGEPTPLINLRGLENIVGKVPFANENMQRSMDQRNEDLLAYQRRLSQQPFIPKVKGVSDIVRELDPEGGIDFSEILKFLQERLSPPDYNRDPRSDQSRLFLSGLSTPGVGRTARVR
jgi:hypothetical protein